MIISPAQPAQAALLEQIDKSQSFSAHWTLQDWQGEFAQPTSYIQCAQEGGQMVGFIVLRGAAGQYELLNLAVCPQCTRQGIGYRLLVQALDHLAAQGAQEVTLEVNANNVAAIELYKKAGFVKRSVRARFYSDGADALLLGKTL
ncbi:MAG: ribosomal protein S18-alanine N-acetyltransferase [Elusimicrobiaceae bacterium]|nr:ribosomal protein S18-alanine N-acetyltransferase [Elusimicrobiaceae bacterium]